MFLHFFFDGLKLSFAAGLPSLLLDCLGCLGVQCRECLSSMVSFEVYLGRLPWQHIGNRH